MTEHLQQAPDSLKNLYADLDVMLEAFGDDVQKTARKFYVAYRRMKNFACVEVHPHDHSLRVFAKVDPVSVELEAGFTRDVRSIGHYGTGDLEIRIRDRSSLDRASELLLRSYQGS